jgi:hypothetical protein
MTLLVPREGLEELFRNWSGDGDIYLAVATAGGTDEIEWTDADVRARAQRILLGKLQPQLLRLPATVAEWEQVIPVVSLSDHLVSTSPRGRVDWGTTARRFGWPPSAFDHRRRYRVQDETALTTLAWMAGQLSDTLRTATDTSPRLVAEAFAPIACLTAAATLLLGNTFPRQPDRSDLLSLESSGYPWPTVAAIAALMVRARNDPAFLAYELLEPDPEAASRLFQLSVFGKVVATLRTCGYQLRWRSPIGGSRPGPRLMATSADGRTLDLWFEAAGIRSHYRFGGGSYPDVVRSIKAAARYGDERKVGRPVGADVALIEPGLRVLLLECKWSESATYVGRAGFHQASSYALDARNGPAERVWSFVVGPEEVVPEKNVSNDFTGYWGITLGSVATPDLTHLVTDFLSETV